MWVTTHPLFLTILDDLPNTVSSPLLQHVSLPLILALAPSLVFAKYCFGSHSLFDLFEMGLELAM